MMKPLVIGVGNRYRGDDSVGLDVAETVLASLGELVDVSFCEGDPLTLMDLWEGRDCVCIVDAVTSDSTELGHIHECDMAKEAVPAIFTNTSTHFLDVIQIVELARALNKLPTKIVLFGIEAKNYAMDEGLSQKLQDMLPEISKEIVSGIRAYTQ